MRCKNTTSQHFVLKSDISVSASSSSTSNSATFTVGDSGRVHECETCQLELFGHYFQGGADAWRHAGYVVSTAAADVHIDVVHTKELESFADLHHAHLGGEC